MMEAKQRRIKAANQSRNASGRNRRKSDSNTMGLASQKVLAIGIAASAILVIGAFYEEILPWNVYAQFAKMAAGPGSQQHAVIIDAGSTGSRVLGFTFDKSSDIVLEQNLSPTWRPLPTSIHLRTSGINYNCSDGSLKLSDSLFVESKPGLSSFASDPSKGAENVRLLLEKAKEFVPKGEWGNTPLALRATAGLRLLPEKKADILLDAVRDEFAQSGFMVADSSVSIMGGTEEGVFSWFTVNLLMDRLGQDVRSTVAALDLGGGSTQITFAPTDKATVRTAPEGYIEEINAFKQKMKVYTYSYLGLGLMAARKAILLHNGTDQNNNKLVASPCVHPKAAKEWKYGGKTYSVRGVKSYETASYDQCRSIAEAVVNEHVHHPNEINRREVAAFSYYFDRAVDTGLIDAATGGTVKVQQFYDMAKKACSSTSPEHPLLCLDLTFISTLLHQGFGLTTDHDLKIVKKIDGHEVSWALGAAYHILENGL